MACATKAGVDWGNGGDSWGWGHTGAEDNTAKLNQAANKGVQCEIKDMFHVEWKQPGLFRWEDEKPVYPGEAEDVGHGECDRVKSAISKYNKYDRVKKEWFTWEISLHNSEIGSALKQVLEGYPGQTQHGLSIFTPPFLPFFHRWGDFANYIDNEADEHAFHYLDLLRKVLLPELEEVFDKWTTIKRTGHIEHKDLKLAFNPGELAVYVLDGIRSVGVMRKASYADDRGETPFVAELDVIDWNGQSCSLQSRFITVSTYDGLRAFTSLDVAPLLFFPDKDALQKDLIARGRLFEKVRGQHFLAYTNAQEQRANERIMVDARAYYKFALQSKFPSCRDLGEIGRLTWDQSMDRVSTEAKRPQSFSVSDGLNTRRTNYTPIARSVSQNEASDGGSPEAKSSSLTDEQCLLCIPTVHGFSMETQDWGTYEVSKLHEIHWDTHAFDNLVLDPEEKDLLLALVEREEFSATNRFDDFISGKGQGLVMLFSGPPGVGKTLTAESVAEHIRRPLYKISAGKLGTHAVSVEGGLRSALMLCSEWKTVCLIDEADVFMAARTDNNLQRNELVSVFLRQLEYHSGILILTTNRLRTLDSAFESRIDIALSYRPLTEADRRQVWANFLHKFDSEDVAIDDAALGRLAKWDFNGRQIKSAVKTGRILAAKKKEPLGEKHLEVVLRLRLKSWGLMGGETDGGVKGDL